jgi:hypothetical protein
MKTADAFASQVGASLVRCFRYAVWTGFCLAIGFTLGCGGGGPAGPQGKVSGKATYNGSPVAAGATVSFIAESGNGSAAGTTAADGSYQLKSTNGDRIPAGKYRVVIMPPAGPTLSPEEAMKQSMANAQSNAAAKSDGDATIPAKYRTIASTPLAFEVKEGDNTIDIPLVDK